MTLRYRHRTAAWLALAAMALNAAWPLLANAQPADPSAEICSASGGKHVAPVTPDKGYHASHCNLCPFGAEHGAAVALAVVSQLLPVPAPVQVFARGETPQRQTALYSAAPPRAPPALS